jgi:hypothetical protein
MLISYYEFIFYPVPRPPDQPGRGTTDRLTQKLEPSSTQYAFRVFSAMPCPPSLDLACRLVCRGWKACKLVDLTLRSSSGFETTIRASFSSRSSYLWLVFICQVKFCATWNGCKFINHYALLFVNRITAGIKNFPHEDFPLDFVLPGSSMQRC